MKNFPHQVSDLDKLVTALRIVDRLIKSKKNVNSDEVLGRALALGRVYAFRDKKKSIRQSLQAEQKKPRANRGSETAARDIRRFLVLSHLVEHSAPPSNVVLTERGRKLLDATEPAVKMMLWREAMLDLKLDGENGQVSHPYRIMLRLVSDRQKIETRKLMLAFEASDDSEAEYSRILSLSAQPYGEILKTTGTSAANAKNAVKILPSIARQLGDIRTVQSESFPASHIDVTEDGATTGIADGVSPTLPSLRAPTSSPVSVGQIATDPRFKEASGTQVDLTNAIEIRNKRMLQHQETVRSLASVFAASGYLLYEIPFDCLAFNESRGAILTEVKTLDGSPSDERRQAALALGQLKGYRFFNIPPAATHERMVLLAAFTQKPSEQTIKFLHSNQIVVTWLEGARWYVQTPAGSGPLSPDALFGILPPG